MIKSRLSLTFTVVLFILFSVMAWTAVSFQKLASYFPLYLSVTGAFLTLLYIIVESRKLLSHNKGMAAEEEHQDDAAWDIPVTESFKTAGLNFLWVIYFFALIFLFGFMVATVIFLISFLKIRTDFSWIKLILSVIITVGLLLVLGDAMELKFPEGIISF